MIKKIIIRTAGPIYPLYGGIYGPILNPFRIEVNEIQPLIIKRYDVNEYLSDGTFLPLTLQNYKDVFDNTIPVIDTSALNDYVVNYGDVFEAPIPEVRDDDEKVTLTIRVFFNNNEVAEVDTKKPGVYTLRYTAMDTAGNISLPAEIKVTVKEEPDTISPVIQYTGPTTIAVNYDTVYVLPLLIATDNKDTSVTVTQVITFDGKEVPSIDTKKPGLYTVVYSAKDAAGNEAEHVTLKITVNEEIDTTPPVIEYTGPTTVNVNYNATYVIPTLTATDNKDTNVAVTSTTKFNNTVVPNVDTKVPGEYEVTYTAKDAANNVATPVVIKVIVGEESDTTAPVINYNGETSISVDYNAAYTIPVLTATDNKDKNVTVTSTIKFNNTTVPQVDTKKSGVYTVTYTAKDAANNAATPVVITVTVKEAPDTTAPVIEYTGPATINVAYNDTYTIPTLTATDNKDSNVTVTSTIKFNNATVTKVDTKIAGEYTVTYTAKDAANNTATPVVIKVIVGEAPDTTAPVISYTGPASVDVDYNATYTIPVLTATDNKDANVTVTPTIKFNNATVAKVDTKVPGVYTVTYNAKDAANNAATPVVITITVKEAPDTTAPVIQYSGETSISVNYNATYTIPVLTATDNKDTNVTVTPTIKFNNATVAKVDTKVPGVYTVTYTAKDAANNAATPVVITVTVKEEPDTTAPVIAYSGPANVDVDYNATYTIPTLTATDNKDANVTVTSVIKFNNATVTTVDTKVPGVYTVTYSAKDAANNAATPVVITVTVKEAPDTTAPVIEYSGPATVNVDYNATYTIPVLTATDNKDSNVTVTPTIKFNNATVAKVDTKVSGEYTVTYTAKDAANNAATPVVIKVVVAEAPDTTAPVINYSGETSISVAYAGTFTNPTVTATDNKDGSITPVRTIKYNNATVASVDTTKSGAYTLEYVATDAAGNKSTTLTITVTVEAQPDVATVTLDKTTASIVVGANTTVKVGVTPANAKIGFTTVSEDDTIAKATYVSTSNGLQTWKIDGLKAGTAKITFTSNYNAEAKKEIAVTVTAAG